MNHLQIEENDTLTTRICELCILKIDEFVIFRKICASTDTRLRTELSNAVAVHDRGVAVTIGAMADMNSSDAEM